MAFLSSLGSFLVPASLLGLVFPGCWGRDEPKQPAGQSRTIRLSTAKEA